MFLEWIVTWPPCQASSSYKDNYLLQCPGTWTFCLSEQTDFSPSLWATLMNGDWEPCSFGTEGSAASGEVSCPFTLANSGDFSFLSQGDAGPAASGGEMFWCLLLMSSPSWEFADKQNKAILLPRFAFLLLHRPSGAWHRVCGENTSSQKQHIFSEGR